MWHFPHPRYIYNGISGDLIRSDPSYVQAIKEILASNPNTEIEINGSQSAASRLENMRAEIAGEQVEPLTLKVAITEQCNLKCGYCPYPEQSGRKHTPFASGLSETRLVEIIQFARERLGPSTALCFYGGEPLYRLKDISRIILEVRRQRPDWLRNVAMTSNMTLFSEKVAAFLVDNRVILLASCDGPEDITNFNRPDYLNRGSYDRLMKNMQALKKFDLTYYREYVGINCVVTTNKFDELDNFFREEFADIKFTRFSIASNQGGTLAVDGKSLFEDMFNWAKQKLLTSDLAELKASPLCRDFIKTHLLPVARRKNVQGGRKGFTSCSPGTRLYLDTDGAVSVCERTEGLRIGSVGDPRSVEPNAIATQFSDMLENRCRSCFAAPSCSVCYAVIWDGSQLSRTKLDTYCKSFRASLSDKLWLYAECRERFGGAEFDHFIEEVSTIAPPIFDEIE